MDFEEAQKLFPPRVVVLISTVDKDGNENVAPHCEFVKMYEENRFLVAIEKTHDTYKNIKETNEFVVALPPIGIAESISICGGSYDRGVSEFEKSNLTPIKGEKVSAPLVKECLSNFECKLFKEIDYGGKCNLIIGEVIASHCSKTNLSDEKTMRLDGEVALHVSKGRVYTTITGNTIDTKIDYKEL
jgi:flavin reductase (DIM6/NTAB) family NADH-FMN oxidoreductase RutF